MNPDELLQMLGSLFSPASAEAAQPQLSFEQRQQLEAQKLVQQLQLMQEKAKIADAQRLSDPLRQAQTAKTEVSVPQSSQQNSLMQILGGDQQAPEGSSIFAYGGGVQPTMESSNDRIRLILDALMQGEAPPGQDPNIGPQAQKDFTQVNPQPGKTFGLKGYEDAVFGFNPETGAFTNIGVPQGPEQAQKTGQPQIDPKALMRHAEIVKALTKNGYAPTQAAQIADQAVPEVAALQQKERLKIKTDEKEAQVDIQRRVQRERFVLENQSNLFKKGSGEPFMLAPESEVGNTEKTLKNYVVLKPENAKDKRQLDGVTGYVNSFKNLLTEIEPLLSSEKAGITGRGKAGTQIAYLRAQGDARVRKMDALAAQITLLARGFGGDSRVSDAEMQKLDKSIINGWTTKEGAQSTLSVLDDFIKNRATSLGFDKYALPKRSQSVGDANILRNKDRKGRPIISKDNGLNWEYE